MVVKTSEQIEIDILKSRLDTLEANVRWLEQNWVHWTKDTKETGQKIMIALTEILNRKENAG